MEASGGAITRPLDDLIDYKYESSGISSSGDTLSTLVRSDGTTTWYQLKDSDKSNQNGESSALVSASLSYTGYLENGQTVQEEGDGGTTNYFAVER